MWHNYVIWYAYHTFHQFLKYAMIFLLQQLVRMAQFTLLAMRNKHQWKLWNGNTWPLYVHMGLVITHGRPDVTLIGLTAHDVLFSFFLTPGKRLWNLYLRNNSIGFDNSHCIYQLVVYRGAKLNPLRHRADLGAKVWFLYRHRRCCVSATTALVHAVNPNALKLSFSTEVSDNMLAYTLEPP